MRHRCRHRLLPGIFVAGAILVIALPALADQLRREGLAYDGQIIGIKKGTLEFRTRGATTKYFPIQEVEIESADAYPQIGITEKGFFRARTLTGQKAGAQYSQSTSSYEAILRKSVPAWLKAVAQTRLVTCYGKTGKFTKAINTFIALARRDPGLVAKLPLPEPDPGRRQDAQVAVKTIDAELKARPTAKYASSLRFLRINLLLRLGKSKEVLPSIQKLLGTGTEEQQQWARIKEIKTLVALRRLTEAYGKVKSARAKLPKTYRPQLDYWVGRILYGKRKYTDAALYLMRTPILYASKNPSLAANSLYWTGKALEKTSAAKAEYIAVYTEAVEKYPGTAGASNAAKALKRLGG